MENTILFKKENTKKGLNNQEEENAIFLGKVAQTEFSSGTLS